MHNKIKFHHLLLIGALVLGSCQKEYVKIQPPTSTPPPVGVKFSTDIVTPFFIPKCATSTCHDGTQKPDLTSSNAWNSLQLASDAGPAYIDTVNDANSLLYTKIALGGTMNDYATITPEERAKVLSWIQEGAKNN